MRWNPPLVTPTYRRKSEYDPPPPPPERLYHATVAMSKLLTEGFRPRRETRKSGLGGGSSDAISLTGTFEVACEIARSIYETVLVARGSATWEDLIRWATRENVLGHATRLFVSSNVSKFNEEPQDEALRRTIEGWKLQEHGRSTWRKAGATKRHSPGTPWVLPKGARDYSYYTGWKDALGRKRYQHWLRRMTEQEQDEARYRFFRAYLAAAQAAGRRYDPVFFGVDAVDLRQLDLNEIGVVEVRMTTATPIEIGRGQEPYWSWRRRRWDPPPAPGAYQYLVAEDEFRVFDLSALQIVGPVDCRLDEWATYRHPVYELRFSDGSTRPITARDDVTARKEACLVAKSMWQGKDVELYRDGNLIYQYTRWDNRIAEYDADGRTVEYDCEYATYR